MGHSPQGKACHHPQSSCCTEKHWCFNSNFSGSYASSRQQVTVKETDRQVPVVVRRIFPQTQRSHILGRIFDMEYEQLYKTVVNRFPIFVCFLHCIVYCIRKWWKWFTFLFGPVKLSSLILTFLGPTLPRLWKPPPGRCLPAIDLSWIWKIFLHTGLIMQTLNLFLEWEITWTCIIYWICIFCLDDE